MDFVFLCLACLLILYCGEEVAVKVALIAILFILRRKAEGRRLKVKKKAICRKVWYAPKKYA